MAFEALPPAGMGLKPRPQAGDYKIPQNIPIWGMELWDVRWKVPPGSSKSHSWPCQDHAEIKTNETTKNG